MEDNFCSLSAWVHVTLVIGSGTLIHNWTWRYPIACYVSPHENPRGSLKQCKHLAWLKCENLHFLPQLLFSFFFFSP